MNNWKDSFNFFNKAEIGYFDVPEDIMEYLKEKTNSIKKCNHTLLGHIAEEYCYNEIPLNIEKFIVSKCFLYPMKRTLDNTDILDVDMPLKLASLWVNYQKKYEFNPSHTHSGIFSFIIFVSIPYDLNKEDNIFPPTNNNEKCTSRLSFIISTQSHKNYIHYLNVDKTFENKMIMFPSDYIHAVYPFYTSDDYRITVSGNIKFDTSGRNVLEL